MSPSGSFALAAVLSGNALALVGSFAPRLSSHRSSSAVLLSERAASQVWDPSGPTAPDDQDELNRVDRATMPEANYDEANIPIPHQPWRRGLTAGCEAPIDAEWRKEAEELIALGVASAGGTYVDTTWYLTSVVVTVGMDFQAMPRDLLRENGPEIRVDARGQPIWHDPDDPNPEAIDFEEDQVTPVYERDMEHEQSIANRTYAKADPEEGEDDSPESLGLDPNEHLEPNQVEKEFREDLAVRANHLRAVRETTEDQPVDWDEMFWFDKVGPEHKKYYGEKINTAALSSIASGILEALQQREDDLQILARHEVVLASPSNPRSLDTQKKLDAAIGKRVAVHTHDPWESNRSLYGVLVDRNALDVYINQQGRLVTIPNNFVAGVQLMLTEEQEEALREREEALMEEEGLTEEEAKAALVKRHMEEFEAELEAELAKDYDDELDEDDYDDADDEEEEEEDDEEDDDGIEEEDE